MANAEWRYLQPEKLTIDPNSHLAEEEWKFWLKTFTNLLEALPRGGNTIDKLKVLTAHLSAPIYKLISEETTYESTITALQNLFVKPKNEICLQQPNKTLVNQLMNLFCVLTNLVKIVTLPL